MALPAAAVLLPAGAAAAHVRVTPETAPAGGYAVLQVRVPNESDTASTTQLRVELPTDVPFSYAAVEPVAGWTASVEEGDLPAPVEVGGTTLTRAPRAITWTAEQGTGIAPGQFQQFPVFVGPLPPEGTTVALPTTQTYSDGTVAAWDDPTPASGEEPEDPAPEFVTTAADGEGVHAGGHGGGSTSGAVTGASSGLTGAAGASTSSATGTATWLGAAGTALGAAALVVALGRGRRSRVRETS